MDFSWVQILTGVGQFLLVAGIAFLVYCLVISHLRFEVLSEQAARDAMSVQPSAPGAELLLASRLAASSRPFLLVMVEVALRDAAALDPAQLAVVEARLGAQVRAQDRMARAEGGGFAFLVEAPELQAGSLLERLLKVDIGLPDALPLKGSLVCYPADRGRAADLISLARQRLQRGELVAKAAASPVAAHTEGPAPASKLLDQLTGVLRAEHLSVSLQKFLARERDAGKPFALVHVDVDNLRRYNSQYGEVRGDRILKALSDFLQRRLREEDLIGRLAGGDEFVVAMSADADQALAAGRRLVTLLRRPDKEGQLDGLRVGISAGVAAWPQHGGSARHVLESARRATRLAKARGRGQCLLADGPAPMTEADDEMKDLL
jgi:diguanylate cyclase (GGDEF)-like protein